MARRSRSRSPRRKSSRRSYKKKSQRRSRRMSAVRRASRARARRSRSRKARRDHFAIMHGSAKRSVTSLCGQRTKRACGTSPYCMYSKKIGCRARKGMRSNLAINFD